MVTVKTFKQHSKFKKIVITGHANYANKGQDIVCAAVSATVITTINAILMLKPVAITYTCNEEPALIKVIVKQNDIIVQKLLENMENELKELEKKYPKYIKTLEEVDLC